MPTLLPDHHPEPPAPPPDRGLLRLLIASMLLLATVALICQKRLPPTPGYSLAQNTEQLQLSP
jgi:hypothetical protein